MPIEQLFSYIMACTLYILTRWKWYPLHSDISLWFRANQFLLLPLNAA